MKNKYTCADCEYHECVVTCSHGYCNGKCTKEDKHKTCNAFVGKCKNFKKMIWEW